MTRIERKIISFLLVAVNHSVPAESRQVTVALNFTSERAVLESKGCRKVRWAVCGFSSQMSKSVFILMAKNILYQTDNDFCKCELKSVETTNSVELLLRISFCLQPLTDAISSYSFPLKCSVPFSKITLK